MKYNYSNLCYHRFTCLFQARQQITGKPSNASRRVSRSAPSRWLCSFHGHHLVTVFRVSSSGPCVISIQVSYTICCSCVPDLSSYYRSSVFVQVILDRHRFSYRLGCLFLPVLVHSNILTVNYTRSEVFNLRRSVSPHAELLTLQVSFYRGLPSFSIINGASICYYC